MKRLLTVFAVCLVACDGQQYGAASSRAGLDPNDPDILPLSQKSEALTGFVAITDDVYSTSLLKKDYAAATAAERDEAFRVSSRANNSRALGIVGNRENNVKLQGQLVLVLHNARVVSGTQYQATSFAVLDGELTGTAAWALVNPTLHFTDTAVDDCDRHFRGCQTVPTGVPHAFGNTDIGGLGLPDDVRLDAEWLDRPMNHGGNSIETWVLPNTDVSDALWPGGLPTQGFIGHRLRCVMPLTDKAVEVCANTNRDELISSSTFVPLPRVALVTEDDFRRAQSNGAFKEYRAEPELAAYATQIAGALNHPRAEGVIGRYVPKSLDGTSTFDALVVARTPNLSEVIHARSVFVVPGPLTFPTSFYGSDLRLHGIDSQYFTWGIFGPVFFPDLQFDPQRPEIPTAFSPTQTGYGTDRAGLGLPRATLRFPTWFHERQSIEVLACSLFEPPLPPPPPVPPQFVPELCNGLDDNGNGGIDESISCNLNSCTGCVPVTTSSCGLRRCLSIPDGCGSVIACPCP